MFKIFAAHFRRPLLYVVSLGICLQCLSHNPVLVHGFGDLPIYMSFIHHVGRNTVKNKDR